MNPNQSKVLFSADRFNECDDPHGHLQSMINQELLNRFDKVGVPSHQLELKVDDICIVMKNLSARYGLANSVRECIVHYLVVLISKLSGPGQNSSNYD